MTNGQLLKDSAQFLGVQGKNSKTCTILHIYKPNNIPGQNEQRSFQDARSQAPQANELQGANSNQAARKRRC